MKCENCENCSYINKCPDHNFNAPRIAKLSAMPYAQAHIEMLDGNIYLFSYTTLVAGIENGWLFVNGLYSMTTRKHISAFLREYTVFNYATAKQLYNDNMIINVETGEVRDRAEYSEVEY